MPKALAKRATKTVIYPPGCKEVDENMSTDELIRRLKSCARAFQDMEQTDNSEYTELAVLLASEGFLEHENKDVRLLAACCIADVFRVFAPEAPYKDPSQLKQIFLFLVEQLRGLEDPKDPAFKRYFYLLENLAWVKSFNICIELEDNQEIFIKLFKLMFSIVNELHSVKVKNFMLDMMTPVIAEADSVSQELLDSVLINICEPRKTHHKYAFELARDLLKRTVAALDQYIQNFFNSVLILGKKDKTDLSGHIYDLIYELNQIIPQIMLTILPQLEYKLKSNEDKERLDATKLLARMFSDRDSDLAVTHPQLWSCFIGRFNDINVTVRTRCVQYAMHFLVNQPKLAKDVCDQLKMRCHDPEENVRFEVVLAIVGAARKEITIVLNNIEILDYVKERTLDKKFKIRKEALLGLAQIYKKIMSTPTLGAEDQEKFAWIRNKVMHAYYQQQLDDRLLVEKILHTCLVPYSLEVTERMTRLYQLYATVDNHALKSINELFKCQMVVRSHVRQLVQLHQQEFDDETQQAIQAKLYVITRQLPDTAKASEYINKFCILLREDIRIRAYMEKLVSPDCMCKKAEECVREVLKKLGNPTQNNVYYMTIKQLLERVAPVMIDMEAILVLLKYVDDSVRGMGEIDDTIGCRGSERGLDLVLMLASVYPEAFKTEEAFTQLIMFLRTDVPYAVDHTLQIFAKVGHEIEHTQPNIYSCIVPILINLAKTGTPHQAKHALQAIHAICSTRDVLFQQLFEFSKNHLFLDSPHCLTALCTVGHLAWYTPEQFNHEMKTIVSKQIVRELLMEDKTASHADASSWLKDEQMSPEVQAKVQGLKLISRWLLGLRSNQSGVGASTLRLLNTMITHQGDLMERGMLNVAEMARLRLVAGSNILKLAAEPCYGDIMTREQFQTVALLINDQVYEVREQFAQKLHKGLITLRLPLEFLGIFALCGNEQSKQLRDQSKQLLLLNINKRREYLRQHAAANAKKFSILPDYVLPYVIHLLAHDADFVKVNDTASLKQLQECLWFIMEPLMLRNENYSYSFLKKLIENIKQTKDAMDPDDELVNYKLYAVCDLALGLVMSKTMNFVLKDFPGEPVLPAKLYTNPDKTYSNNKLYLPREFAFTPPRVRGKAAREAMMANLSRIPAALPRKTVSTTNSGNTTQLVPRGRGRPRKYVTEMHVEVIQAEEAEEEEEEEEQEEEDESKEEVVHEEEVPVEVKDVSEGEARLSEEEADERRKRPGGGGDAPTAKRSRVEAQEINDEEESVEEAESEEVQLTTSPSKPKRGRPRKYPLPQEMKKYPKRTTRVTAARNGETSDGEETPESADSASYPSGETIADDDVQEKRRTRASRR